MKMTIAIIDDEQHCIDRLVHLLRPHSKKFDIATFDTLGKAVEGLDRLRPDIVFLDVQLGEGTGFDLLSEVGHREFSLIFTTAYEKYAVEAFRFSAMAYLLKPVDREDFEEALQKATSRAQQNQLQERLDVLLTHISRENTSKRISIPHREGYAFPLVSDIVRCQADVNYTHFFCVNGKKYTASKTLKHFEQLLPERQFFRIHNSHLINLDYVASYDKNGYALLTDGSRLEVSTRKKEAFIKACTRP